ncbi:MAG: Crp/Fnr family transcriptional regulator [Bauldia sp.]|nr:Crp/Fnr family transcriptional regulator [Bauldia sp.]
MIVLQSTPAACLLRIRQTGVLPPAAEHDLNAALADSRLVEPRQDIVVEGRASDLVVALLDGFACRYKTVARGRRQITGLLLPGDFEDTQPALGGVPDHSVATVTACRVAMVPRRVLERLFRDHKAIEYGFQCFTQVELRTLREWLLNMGQRMADRQVAHLFCELLHRMGDIAMVVDRSFSLPFTQEELADVLGLSTVHVNRVLQELRRAGLVRLDQRRLTIVDYDALRILGEFDPAYLEMPGPIGASLAPARY